MGNWGFRKSIRLGRAARITLGKKSVGFSVGSGPFRVGLNSKSGLRERVTIPGTGLYYEQRSSRRRRKTSARAYLPILLAVVIIAIALGHH